jgi:hypothetical protein
LTEFCKYCGAELARDSIGLRCPTKNCQWEHGVPKPDMRDPRTNPRKGDKLAKVTDHRVRTRTVISVVAGVICYTPKRVLCYCSREDWCKWAKDATVPYDYQKAKEPYRQRKPVMKDYAASIQKLANSPLAKRHVVQSEDPAAPATPGVLYAHEFAYQLLAGENKRIVVVLPTFDMPGMATAHTPQAVPVTVENVECLAITAKP